MYAVITENDESQWSDDKGVLYHFPKRYERILREAISVVYYKGSCKNKSHSASRLSDKPHYFGIAKIGDIYNDNESEKGDMFAIIKDFIEFEKPVIAKTEEGYIEYIPINRKNNYWRDGVRLIDKQVLEKIISLAQQPKLTEIRAKTESYKITNHFEQSFESLEEGQPHKKYVTYYERNPKLRRQAIAIHGKTCQACGFNFKDYYGDYGADFIHIHHICPISELSDSTVINPETDMVPLCANCHAMIHRQKNKTLSVLELKNMIKILRTR